MVVIEWKMLVLILVCSFWELWNDWKKGLLWSSVLQLSFEAAKCQKKKLSINKKILECIFGL